MGDKFEVKDKGGFLSGIPNVTPSTFTVTNKETGEKSDVIAWTRSDVGPKIADGKFSK